MVDRISLQGKEKDAKKRVMAMMGDKKLKFHKTMLGTEVEFNTSEELKVKRKKDPTLVETLGIDKEDGGLGDGDEFDA